MKIVIEPADMERDRKILIEALRRYLTPNSDERRFNWLCRENPQGPARAWLARDSESGEVVGASAAFSRLAVTGDQEKRGWVLGDFCMAEKCRSLGPALQLQKATLSALDEAGGADFCYDFPGRQMVAIYKRFGIEPCAQMVRLARPLRLHREFARSAVPKPLAQAARRFGNLLLRASDLRILGRGQWEIALHEGECGEDFSALWEQAGKNGGVAVRRSAQYMNWRYLRHPLLRHQILTARRAGELQGYVVFHQEGDHAQIAEWCTADDALLGALVRDLAHRLRGAGAVTLSAFLLDRDPRLPLMRKLGFWRRESSPVMVRWRAGNGNAPEDWRLMQGDRDI